MPYRIDVPCPPADALDRLVALGALDVEPIGDGVAAILPDQVTPDEVAALLGVAGVAVSAAVGRDDGSVWEIGPRVVRIGNVVLAPPGVDAPPNAIRLTDSPAFGTGRHPTTALCLEALAAALAHEIPDRLLDIGTGSAVLALAGLRCGVPRGVGTDIDPIALNIAAEHARLNGLGDRLQLVHGGPEAVAGTWPLVLANILPAPLIDMAPRLVQRLAHRGELILSGIPCSVVPEVQKAYSRFGMHHVRTDTRAGWAALVLRPSW